MTPSTQWGWNDYFNIQRLCKDRQHVSNRWAPVCIAPAGKSSFRNAPPLGEAPGPPGLPAPPKPRLRLPGAPGGARGRSLRPQPMSAGGRPGRGPVARATRALLRPHAEPSVRRSRPPGSLELRTCDGHMEFGPEALPHTRTLAAGAPELPGAPQVRALPAHLPGARHPSRPHVDFCFLLHPGV